MNEVIRGVVVEVRGDNQAARVSIVLGSESPGSLPRTVIINAKYHHDPVFAAGKYSTSFGQLSPARSIKMHDAVLLIRHRQFTDVAWKWCFQDDKVVPANVKPVATPKKVPYGEKRRLRRIRENQEQYEPDEAVVQAV